MTRSYSEDAIDLSPRRIVIAREGSMELTDSPRWNFLRGLPSDGLPLPTIKQHSFEKIHRHNLYAAMFATGMKNQWPQRAYLGLYSGAGRAFVAESGEIIETTALSALRLRDPFTKYIFVEREPIWIDALEKRTAALSEKQDVSFILGDVNLSVGEIGRRMPKFSRENRLLTFCFVDPCAADLQFRTIRLLADAHRMDFLILLALGVDIRRNLRQYFEDPHDPRVADLIDSPQWRREYLEERTRTGEGIVRFVARKFDEAMTSIGYNPARPGHLHEVKVRGKGVMQYILVLYSKSDLGQKFWEVALSSSDPQQQLGL